MSKDGHFVFTVHEDNRIAPGKGRVHGTGRVVPDTSDDIRDDAIRWGEDRLAEGKIILVFLAFTLMRSARFIDNQEVESEALTGRVVMVVEFFAFATPENQPLAIEG